VTIVRILFVALALLTGGLWVLAYVVMMLVIPFANTAEEHAAAAGAPFNAQEVIDRAKKHYGEFKDRTEWRRHWREQRREWRQQRREWRRKWHEGVYWWGHNLQRNVHTVGTGAGAGAGYGTHLGATLLIPFLAILNALLFCLWIAAIVSLATTGGIFGWAVVGSLPLWAAILILLFVYRVIARPLRLARRAIYFSTTGYHYLWFAAWYEILSVGVLIAVCWFAYTHVPAVHDFFQHLAQNWSTMWNNVIDSFRHPASHAPASQASADSWLDACLSAAGAAASSAFLALRG
jgi:hypothetical protein